ncbi:MAG: hypothetical protein K2J30_04525 [Clostridia bacterium]|nr:hypothetical protein [Clostridia bacterium]
MATQKTKTKRTNYAARTKRENEAPKHRNNVGARILCIVLALVIIVSAALMIMQFCTPYKPSNGFKPTGNQTTVTPPDNTGDITPPAEDFVGDNAVDDGVLIPKSSKTVFVLCLRRLRKRITPHTAFPRCRNPLTR